MRIGRAINARRQTALQRFIDEEKDAKGACPLRVNPNASLGA
jgi:hypothetical protein